MPQTETALRHPTLNLEWQKWVARSPSGGSTTATRCHGWLLADVGERRDDEMPALSRRHDCLLKLRFRTTRDLDAGAAGELTSVFATPRSVKILFRGWQIYDFVTVFRFRGGVDR